MSSNVFDFDEQNIEITDYTDIDSDVKVLIVTAVTDAVMNQIAGGNAGEVLSKNSNADNDFIWISVAKTIEKKIVVTDNEPYSGAVVGNAYLEITASNGNKSYIALIYDELKDKPIIQQDLDSLLFTPVINTYYKHTGTSEGQFWNGVIYFYDGELYSIIITKKQADDLYVHKTVNNTNRFAYIRDFGTETILPISQAPEAYAIAQYDSYGSIRTRTSGSEPPGADLTAINAWFLTVNFYNKIQIANLLAGKQDSLTENQLAAVNSGIDSTKVAQIAANKNSIDTINSKIPAAASSSNQLVDAASLQSVESIIESIFALIPQQASAENQLADKAFVNSSIATNTANFLGTYNIVTDLGLTTSATESQIAAALALKLSQLSITVTNNDYVYVAYPNATQPQQFDRYDRYKFSESSDEWEYEFTLNNSSFTAEQWAAINSGITATLVSNYSSHITNKNNPHEVTKTQVGLGNVDNTSDATKKENFTGSITADNPGFVTGGEAYTEFEKKVNTSDLPLAIVNGQVTVAIAINFVTNINGRQMVYYVANATSPEQTVYQIKYLLDTEDPSSAVVLSEEQAAEYLHYMTGSQYVPKYNYNFPHNTYIVLADGSLWKPQYNGIDNEGLLLYKMPKVFATTADLNDYISKSSIDQTFFNNLF